MIKLTHRKRRWYQLSLRTLMLLVILSAFGSDWLYNELHYYRANADAIESLTARRVGVESIPGPLGQLWRFCGYNSTQLVERVKYNGSGINDEDMRHLKELRDLKELDLNHTVITDVTLAHLTNKRCLNTLHIAGTRISDSGLQHLSHLSRLQYLDLSHNKDVTDEGLTHLKRLRNLSNLRLLSTRVTATGAQELQTALPDCKIATNSIWARATPRNVGHSERPSVVAN